MQYAVHCLVAKGVVITNHDCAVFTTAKDNAVHLPVWLKYYSRYFAPSNIYVLDHNSVDGSIDGLGVSVYSIHNKLYNDNLWLINEVKNMQTCLLRHYRYVLYSHPDEIIVADPAQYSGGLSEYILKNTKPIVRCNGRGIVQNLNAEKNEIDWNRPIFEQRRWWYQDIHDCKPLLSNQPLNWSWGFHDDGVDRPIDPALYLVHLHRADLKSMLERHAWMRQQTFHPEQGDRGFHHKWSDEEVIKSVKEFQHSMTSIPRRFDGSVL